MAMSSIFPFTAGRLCLWFTATVGNRGSQSVERLQTADDLSRWCVEANVLENVPGVADTDVEDARTLREAIYRTALALRKGDTPEVTDIAIINGWAALPPPAPQLNIDGRSSSRKARDSIKAAFALIARDAIELFTSRDVERLKLCAQPVCAMLFLDTSRSGQRRWCSMNICGNREKKTKFRKARTKVGEK